MFLKNVFYTDSLLILYGFYATFKAVITTIIVCSEALLFWFGFALITNKDYHLIRAN